MKIYKNKISPLLAVFIFLLSFSNIAIATQDDYMDFKTDISVYSGFDYNILLNDANRDFTKYLKSQNQAEKELFLNSAMRKYYTITKIDNSKIPPLVQLGRIYDEKGNYELAVEYFHKALNMDSNHPYANLYLGDFYFKRKEYKKAIKYYNKAYNNGLAKRYELNLRLAIIYEKFADLANAKKYYEISYSMKPDNKIKEKILLINELNYDKTEYYHYIRE